jgi:hypothetical protein
VTGRKDALIKTVTPPSRAKRSQWWFTVVFYGLGNFGCRSAQFYLTQRQSETVEHLASSILRNAVKNRRKKSFLNYDSPILNAQLQASYALRGEHPLFNVQSLTEDVFFAEISDCPQHSANLFRDECRFGMEP